MAVGKKMLYKSNNIVTLNKCIENTINLNDKKRSHRIKIIYVVH